MAQRDTYLVALLEVQNIAITEYGLFSSGCLEHLLQSATLHNACTGSNEAYIKENIPKIFVRKIIPPNRVAGLGRLSAGAKMAMKPFVKRVFTIFATNASFLRVISNFRI